MNARIPEARNELVSKKPIAFHQLSLGAITCANSDPRSTARGTPFDLLISRTVAIVISEWPRFCRGFADTQGTPLKRTLTSPAAFIDSVKRSHPLSQAGERQGHGFSASSKSWR